MFRVGLSSDGFELTEENFKLLRESKIDIIEVRKPVIDFEAIKVWSERYGVELWSCHLPFTPFKEINIATSDQSLRERSIQLYTELIQKGTDVGIKKFVVHPSGKINPEDNRAECIKYSMQSLDQLAEIAYQYGAVIAVEDLPRNCLGNTIAELAQIISANDKLRICLDTNHLLQDDNVEFIKRFGDKIVTLHVSDYDFLNERHWLPGEGQLDWQGILAALKEVGYSGPWMYEMYLCSTKNIIREKDLSFSDIYDNAMSLFANKKPKVMGTIVEGLGGWQ